MQILGIIVVKAITIRIQEEEWVVKEPKTISVSFRVSARFKECLAAAAEHERRTQTNFLENLVFSYCEEHGLAPSAKAIPGIRKRKPSSKNKTT